MTETTNYDLKKIDGTDNWREIFDDHNDSMDIIDTTLASHSAAIAKVQNGLAYIVGDTNTTGGTLAVGQFVYVKNHSTIAEGLRKVTASISANGDITTNNTSACPEGGINALSKFTRKEYQFGSLAFSAGTIGTRGVQTSIDITSDLNTYGTLISLLITLISDSSKCHFQIFRYGNSIYLNGYRATDAAMASNSVNILATYMKN